jgi:hypothetical protein
MRETDDIGAAISAAAATVSAPAGLRERVVVQQEKGRVRRRRFGGLLAAMGVVAAALVVALVLTLPGDGASPVQQASALALAQPTSPAPGPMPGTNHLDAVVGGVAFPDWAHRRGWHAVGQRSDEVAGRPATTVFYENGAGQRVGYTIVADRIEIPDGHDRTVGGTDVTLLRHDDAAVVAWHVRDVTCVLAAQDVSGAELTELASWSGYA